MFLQIKNFKCHQNFEETLPNLTVLCGKNGTGKSSVIQALILCRIAAESIRHSKDPQAIVKTPLNGGLYDLALGTGGDIIFDLRGSPPKSEIISDNFNISFYLDDNDDQAEYLWTMLDPNTFSHFQSQKETYDRLPRFVYLSAERIGPRLIQPAKQGHRLSVTGIGVHGENSAEFLKLVQRNAVDQSIAKYAETDSSWLGKHLEFWMSRLFGKLQVRIVDNGQFAPPSVQFLTGGVHGEWVHATNQGFGMTYALPIILVSLASQPGDMLIIDSPEAHLHPSAQTAMAIFLGIIAENGRTILVETHSDHIIDGIRLAVAEQKITPEAAKILFFNQDDKGQTFVEKIKVSKDGSLSHWPSDFFDQMSLNLRALSEHKKRVRTK